jgi:hypothetical protein
MDDDQLLAELQDQLRNLRIETNAVIEQIDHAERRIKAQRQKVPIFLIGQRVRIRNPPRPATLDSFGTVSRVTASYVYVVTDRGHEIHRIAKNIEHVREY